MANKRPEAERNLGLFLSPSSVAGQGGYLVPMDNLNVGPGKPGPGDEWDMPAEMQPIEPEGAAGRIAPEPPGRPAAGRGRKTP
jgi:hypothetical protein